MKPLRMAFVAMVAVLLAPPSADALTPKAGATCSKLGQVVDFQGKRFTCIKSGSKKVWNKGIVIKPSTSPSAKASVTPSPSVSPSRTSSPTPTSTATNGVREFTLAQVSAHNSASSCWSAINGDVYDLTTWIGQHPGGASAIQRICGTDGTQSFNNQHEGSGKVARQLSQFYIGRLKS